MSISWASTARIASRTGSQTTWSDSVDTSRVTCPAGSSATKNRALNRRGSKTGVVHEPHSRSRSVRSTRPRRARKAGERHLAALQAATVLLPVLPGRVPDDGVLGRTGQQHAGLLEGLAHRRADQCPGERLVAPEQVAPLGGARSDPADVGVEVAPVHAAAGEHAHARGERHVDVPPQQVDLEPAGLPVTVAQQHHRRGVPGLDGLAAAVVVRLRVLDEVGRQPPRRVHQTSTRSSTSTGASSGSTGHADGDCGRAGRRRRTPRRTAPRRRWRPRAAR